MKPSPMVLEIPHGKEKEFLWPLGIEKINGVGKQTEQQLKNFGIYTIEDIAKTPIEYMEKYVGKWGEASGTKPMELAVQKLPLTGNKKV